MCHPVQPISTKLNTGDDVSSFVGCTSKQPQQAGGHQAYPATMEVCTTH